MWQWEAKLDFMWVSEKHSESNNSNSSYKLYLLKIKSTSIIYICHIKVDSYSV